MRKHLPLFASSKYESWLGIICFYLSINKSNNITKQHSSLLSLWWGKEFNVSFEIWKFLFEIWIFLEVVYSLESTNLKMWAKSCLVLTHVHTGNNYDSFVCFRWEFMCQSDVFTLFWSQCQSVELHTDVVTPALSQQQTPRLLLIHDAEEIITASKRCDIWNWQTFRSKHVLTFRLVIKKYCLALSSATRRPHCSKSQRTRGDRKVNQLQGVYGMSSRRNSPSTTRVKRADDFLCDVLLSGWPVNVSDHTLHHPLDAFVHSIPCEGSTRLD